MEEQLKPQLEHKGEGEAEATVGARGGGAAEAMVGAKGGGAGVSLQDLLQAKLCKGGRCNLEG